MESYLKISKIWETYSNYSICPKHETVRFYIYTAVMCIKEKGADGIAKKSVEPGPEVVKKSMLISAGHEISNA